ncbi:polysaccharide deacetylase family protein [Lacrimispora sp.]|uniref:polysaccharide deacetylase family protein n=1 Tax=Lacrimispora sp. TaxID=2719234 RepID=UPI0028A982AE|nr:polysaccharide deacetylase family protein [Lacrimispora sp.]
MKKFLQLISILMAIALVIAFVPAAPFSSMADETAPAPDRADVRLGWIDENQGPGVARWVDENGNISKQPGKAKAESQSNSTQETQEEKAGESSQGSGTSQSATGESGQAETQAETQPETQPATQPETQPAETGRQIDPALPMVALTFDDGPYAPVGNQIMDSLAQYGGKATFFVVGSRAAAYQTELKRMVAEGHEIGNHTFDHKYLTKLNGAQIQSEINRCNDAVFAASGVRPALVRLPGGLKNHTVLANVNAPIIMWSIDTLDWKTRNTSKTVNAVLSHVKDGDIVLMHELYSQTGAAALEIIPKLAAAGYQMVTVSEMAQYRGGVVPSGVYSQFHR